jgi:hypothetical protein
MVVKTRIVVTFSLQTALFGGAGCDRLVAILLPPVALANATRYNPPRWLS